MGRRRLFWLRRWWRRPGFPTIVVASLALHLILFLGVDLLYRGPSLLQRDLPFVEIPLIEPPGPGQKASPPPAPKGAPPKPKRAPVPPKAPPLPSVAKAPTLPPVPVQPAPARPTPAPPPEPMRAPAQEASPAAPKPELAPAPVRPESVPSPAQPEPTPGPPAVVATPAPAPPPVPSAGAAAAPSHAPSSPSEQPEVVAENLLKEQRLSMINPQLDVPPLPGERPSAKQEGGGGTAIPLTTEDPRYHDYFEQIKRKIEDILIYPQEAAQKRQAGRLLMEFTVQKDGSVRFVRLLDSSGYPILDSWSLRAVQIAAPFPPIPDRIKEERLNITASFTYIITTDFRGFRLY